MRKAIFLAFALTTYTNLIQAADFDILDTYKHTAEEILVVMEKPNQESIEINLVNSLLTQLIEQGTATMNLISERKPECALQFATFIQEIPTMMSMNINDIHKRYHDGIGLPSAPRFCYFGRSQVVHPVMSKILLNSGWDAEVKEEVIEQTNEVLEHCEKIKKLLQ